MNLAFPITGPFVKVTTGSGVARGTVCCAAGAGVGVAGGGVARVAGGRVVCGDIGGGDTGGGGVARVAGVGVVRGVAGGVVDALTGRGTGRGSGRGNRLRSAISFVLNRLGRITIFGSCRRGSWVCFCWPSGSCHSQISNTASPASVKSSRPTSNVITQPDMNLFVLL